MRIVIAMDSFKGSISSTLAAQIISDAFNKEFPNIEITKIPMADGGEGTVEAIIAGTDGEIIFCKAENPLGQIIESFYGWIPDTKTAIIEMAAASGLPLLKDQERNPALASTYGTGELIKSALDKGAQKIIIGLGGSATVDAGAGCFQALGIKFYDKQKNLIKRVGGRLNEIADIDLSDIDTRFNNVKISIASDVSNPLLGKNGAIYIFGPQKGIKQDELRYFEDGMEHFAELVNKVTGKNMINTPGSGAAGGFGFSLSSFLDAETRSGFDLIAELTNLENYIKEANLVITGEGSIDAQSIFGKTPVGISRIAKKYNIPVIAFAGKIGEGTEILSQEGITLIFPIVDQPMSLEEAIQNGPQLLYKAAKRLITILKIGNIINSDC